MRVKKAISLMTATPRLKFSWAIILLAVILAIFLAAVNQDLTAILLIISIGPILIVIIQKIETSARLLLQRNRKIEQELHANRETNDYLSKRIKHLSDELRRGDFHLDSIATQSQSSLGGSNRDWPLADANTADILELIARSLNSIEGGNRHDQLSPVQRASVDSILFELAPESFFTVGVETKLSYGIEDRHFVDFAEFSSSSVPVEGSSLYLFSNDLFKKLTVKSVNWNDYLDSVFLVAIEDGSAQLLPPVGFIEIVPTGLTYGVRAFYPEYLVGDEGEALQ